MKHSKLTLGKYVLAVSGGVDSMVLLDLLVRQKGLELVVAHFNHGIRDDAGEDEKLVTQTAKKLGLPIEVGRARLGKGASEAAAREARYKFLGKVRQKHRAAAIITAHHQDDLLETALLNILRGSGRRGLTAMQHNPKIMRPLLNTPKADILAYAKRRKIKWREDETNKDLRYRRNYLRAKVLPRLTAHERTRLLKLIKDLAASGLALDNALAPLATKIQTRSGINRSLFSLLPTEIANELTAYFLRAEGFRQFDKPTIQRLALAIKTAPAGSQHDVGGRLKLKLTTEVARFELRG